MINKKRFVSSVNLQKKELYTHAQNYLTNLALVIDELTVVVGGTLGYHAKNVKAPIEHEEGLNGRSIYKIQNISQSFQEFLAKRHLQKLAELADEINRDLEIFVNDVKFYFPDEIQ